MSVVIIGGHDRMVCQYKKVCKQFNCKAKIFTQMSASLSKQIGSPDLIVPVVLRPAYTLGGSGGGIAHNQTELEEILENVCA